MRLPRCYSLARWRHTTSPTILSHSRRRTLTTLAIETSCDDTAVAVLTRSHDGTKDTQNRGPQYSLLFNERISSDHREFRGIEPLVAVQGHTTAIAPLVRKALAHLPDADPSFDPTTTKHKKKAICWTEDGRPKQAPDFISVTRGPGIMPNLSVGLSTAKGLAVAWDVPLVGVHHMQAHALTPRLVNAIGIPMAADTGRQQQQQDQEETKEDNNNNSSTNNSPEFPFLTLLVSGGHTQLVHSQSLTSHRIIATTADVAIGNLLDHAARSILPPEVLSAAPDVMYGRHLESFAFPEGGTPSEYAFYKIPSNRGEEMTPLDTGYSWKLPTPLRQSRKISFTFTGIGVEATKIGNHISSSSSSATIEERRSLARFTLASAFRHLAGRICIALQDDPSLQQQQKQKKQLTLVVAGGVACNRFLMHVLRETLAARGFGDVRIIVPPPSLCTDNAAMIAWAGMEMYNTGWHTDLSALAINKWPMDPEHGHGMMGAPGWMKRT